LGDACDACPNDAANDVDGDGVCGDVDNCPTTANASQTDTDLDGLGDACDACPNDAANDVDGDGVCGDVDNCPMLSNAGQANFDADSEGDACDLDDDNDGLNDTDEAIAGTNPLNPDTDGDSFLDGADSCPLVTGQIGSVCDANGPAPGFILGTLNGSCVCAAAPCTQNLTLEFQNDANPSQVTWEIREQGTNTLVISGIDPMPPGGVGTVNACVPNGSYYLKVLDSGNDGMGGYTLRTGTVLPGSYAENVRLIDNKNNFTSGGLSQVAGNQGFTVPVGGNITQGIYSSCDKLDWLQTGEYFVCDPVTNVSNVWNAGNTPAEATTGYEYWIYNPNGGYSYRTFHSHAVSDGFAPDNATRACHMKINNWLVANYIPSNQLMNVRVRSRINGTNYNWGPACRFKIDPVAAACPLTKLMDIPGNPTLSCGSTRKWGNGNYVHARPVTGATQYQFRFRIDAEGFLSVRTVSTYFVQLNWPTFPLQDGKTYDVEVRAYKGGVWCVNNTNPSGGTPFVAWGDVCLLTIDNTPANGGNENISTNGSSLRMYPNPNRGDQLYLSLDAVEEGVQTVSVDIFDLTGKRLSARTIATQGGFINTTLELNGELANGMYIVNITAGKQHYTERLVISK
ncbi:MAG: thrombospondin type 3 repeat-containing protein, partial [Flavobacteriales bacterium]